MEEITQVDHRTTISVFESDRNSAELLAMTYQRVADLDMRFASWVGSIPESVQTTQNPVFMQEART